MCSSGGYAHVSRIGEKDVLWTVPQVDSEDPREQREYCALDEIGLYGSLLIPGREWSRWCGRVSRLPKARVRLPPPHTAPEIQKAQTTARMVRAFLMEAAGVEPASANGSYRVSTCVASLSVSPGAASEQPTPRLATWSSHLWPG